MESILDILPLAVGPEIILFLRHACCSLGKCLRLRRYLVFTLWLMGCVCVCVCETRRRSEEQVSEVFTDSLPLFVCLWTCQTSTGVQHTRRPARSRRQHRSPPQGTSQTGSQIVPTAQSSGLSLRTKLSAAKLCQPFCRHHQAADRMAFPLRTLFTK